MDENISERAMKDYCFNYNEKTDEISGTCYRNTNPKRLVEGISLKELLNGNDVMFEICKGYDESFLEEADPDVYNEVAYSKSCHLLKKSGPTIAELTFDELAKEMDEITENGFVKKQIITHGFGDLVPENSYVTVEYDLYKEKDPVPFDSTVLRNRAEKFRMDRMETIKGLYYAVKSMKKHEKSRFCIKWEYGFGALGCPDRIEPKCNIIADVTLIDYVEIVPMPNSLGFTDEDSFIQNFDKLLNEAKVYHLQGTDLFKKGDVFKAISRYRRALRILNDLKLSDENEESSFIKQKVKCLINLAICYNKVGKFEQACLACQDILAIDCNNVKAFFHYGKACLALSNFSQAQKWLKKASHIKPFDPDINQELKKLNEKKSFHETMTKDFWEKAFEKASLVDNKKNEKSEMTN